MSEQDPSLQPYQPGDIEHKEKEQIRHIIVVDDNYADNLAGIFEEGEEPEKPQVDQAQDLEGALALIDSIKDPRGAGVMTDLFFPEKKESPDQAEGLKVIQEILTHFGVDQGVVAEMIANYQAFVASQRGGYRATVAKEVQKRRAHIEAQVKEVFNVEYEQPENPKLKEFFAKNLYDPESNEGVNEIFEHIAGMPEGQSIYEDWDKIYEEEKQKGYVTKSPEGKHIITQAGFEEYNAKGWLPKRYEGNGKEFLRKICYSLTNSFDGGILMGVRVAEAAHQKNLPVTIVTGAHGTQPVNVFVARYLFDKGIISNSYIGHTSGDSTEEDLNQYSFFETNKKYHGDELQDSKTKKILQTIGKTLESKIQQQKY